MEKQLRLKQVMLAASLMLSGALHAMDSTDAKNLDTTSNTPVTVNSDLIVEESGSVDAGDILKPNPDLAAKIAEVTGVVSEEVIDVAKEATVVVGQEALETATTSNAGATGVVGQETLETAAPSNSWVNTAWYYLTGETARQETEKKAAQVAERQVLIAQRNAEAMAAAKARVAAEAAEAARLAAEAQAAAQAAAEAVEFAEQQEVLRQLQESEATKLAAENAQRVAENAQRAADEVANSYANRAFSAAASMKNSVLNRAASLKDSAMDAAGNSWTSTKDAIVANPGTTAAVVIATAAAAGSAWYVYRALYGRELTTVEYITVVDKLGKQDIAELEKGDKANAVSAISTLKVPRVDGPLKALIEALKTQLNNLYVAKNVNDYNTALAEALNRLEEAAKPKPVAQDVPATTTTVTAQARAAVNAVWGYFTPKQTTPSIAQMNKALEQSLAVLDNNTQGTANVIVNRVTVESDGESSKTTATTPSTTQVINQGSNVADQAVVAKPVSVNTQTATVTKRPTISFQSVRAIRPTSQFKALEIANIDADYIMQSIDNQRVLIALIFTNCTFNNSAEDYKKANKTLEEILNNAIADAQDVTRQQELQTLKTACGAAYKADLAALKAYNTTK